MTRRLATLAALAFLFGATAPSDAYDRCADIYGAASGQRLSLATGSPGELGLVKALVEAYNKVEPVSVCWKKAGSGASLKLLEAKAVDLIMVHAPAAEKKAVADGWAANRTLIGSNEFYLVGPPEDSAKIAEAKDAADAYRRIAQAQAKFFTRGDNSGTHMKELAIWGKAGVKPEGAWYVTSADFMAATLKRASDEGAYFMTDSSTWIAEGKNAPNLRILFRGDKFLVNTYHALSVPEGATGGAAAAARFVRFLASEAGQGVIRDFGKDVHGRGIYDDAAYASQYDD
ncbi:MAG: substrate-binding domain-containing protein [Deferrisomatales bacterium]|nr:substrate-binding domain-containing protein [Deferrisomatales bacterium]